MASHAHDKGAGENSGQLSSWAVRRFGSAAAFLQAAIPERLGRAHERARASHQAARLKRRSPYGRTVLDAAREEFAELAQSLDGDARDLRGYTYAVVRDQVLFPFKYADRPAPLERARMARESNIRKRLYRAHGPEAPDTLFELDDSLTTEEFELLHETFEELGRQAKLVSVFFTADAENGIHAIHWGDARLETDRTFSWAHSERLFSTAP